MSDVTTAVLIVPSIADDVLVAAINEAWPDKLEQFIRAEPGGYKKFGLAAVWCCVFNHLDADALAQVVETAVAATGDIDACWMFLAPDDGDLAGFAFRG